MSDPLLGRQYWCPYADAKRSPSLNYGPTKKNSGVFALFSILVERLTFFESLNARLRLQGGGGGEVGLEEDEGGGKGSPLLQVSLADLRGSICLDAAVPAPANDQVVLLH